MVKGFRYEEQLSNLRKARKIRDRLLELRADRFTVGELIDIMKEPHFSTSTSDLNTMLKVAEGKPVNIEPKEESHQ